MLSTQIITSIPWPLGELSSGSDIIEAFHIKYKEHERCEFISV